jgi:hypothetical protein
VIEVFIGILRIGGILLSFIAIVGLLHAIVGINT